MGLTRALDHYMLPQLRGNRIIPGMLRGGIAADPSLQRDHQPGDSLLAHLHRSSDPPVLQVAGAHPVLASADQPGGRRSHRFMTALNHQIGPGAQIGPHILVGSGIDNTRNAAGMGDPGALFDAQVIAHRTDGAIVDEVNSRGLAMDRPA